MRSYLQFGHSPSERPTACLADVDIFWPGFSSSDIPSNKCGISDFDMKTILMVVVGIWWVWGTVSQVRNWPQLTLELASIDLESASIDLELA